MDFYSELEEGVRDWVRKLRDAGINTECSCGHEGYIQCQTLDPQNDIDRIKRVLHDNDLWDYEIHFIRCSHGKDYSDWKETIQVNSRFFKAKI